MERFAKHVLIQFTLFVMSGVVFGAAPSNVVVRQIPGQLHVTWTDNSSDEYYFSLERQIASPIPGAWSEIAQISPNHTSYQMNNPINTYTYSFRLRAVTEEYSDYSNTASWTVGLLWYSLKLNKPNGEKDLAVEGVYPILWSNNYNPPAMVNLYYSLDGGSNWTTIVSNYPNTGYYYWKLPSVSTRECIVKITKSTDALSYDLTDTAFKIQGYDFDLTGTQGWSVSAVTDEDDYAIEDADFRFNWRDLVDYPVKPGSDPAGNLQGTLAIVKDTPGIIYSNYLNINAKFWHQDVISPDLTTLDYWQQAIGVQVRIAHCMDTGGKLYSNMIIHVYDTDLNANRYFTYPQTASELSYCHYGTTNVWNTRSTMFSNIPGFPAHYIFKRVTVRIWGDLNWSYGEENDGSVFIDDVFPLHHAKDYDSDGDTDLADFSALSTAWGTSSADPTWNPIFDRYNSGLIDFPELHEFVTHWLEGVQ